MEVEWQIGEPSKEFELRSEPFFSFDVYDVSLSACWCFYLSKKMICVNRLGIARGAKPKFSAVDLI